MSSAFSMVNPIHSYFGYEMRWNPKEAHHLYWGLMLCVINAWGAWTALGMALYGYYHQFPLQLILGLFFTVIQLLSFSIGVYVAHDDINQHHQQVMQYNPLYHSPVHIWYGETLWQYPFVQWLNKIVSKLIHNL